jgi:hypothetical protein
VPNLVRAVDSASHPSIGLTSDTGCSLSRDWISRTAAGPSEAGSPAVRTTSHIEA